MGKPIRVFFNELSRRFYATAHYKEKPNKAGTHMLVTITGTKFDVTDDIAKAMKEHDIEFTVQ